MNMIKHLFKNGLTAIKLVFSCSPGAVLCKLLGSAAVAVLAPVSIWLTQNLVDSVLAGGGSMEDFRIWGWAAALLVAMFFSASGSRAEALLDIVLKRKLCCAITDRMIEKHHKIEYACYENKETFDVISRMGNSPERILLDAFLKTAETFVYFVSIVGNAVVFSQLGLVFSVVYLLCLLPLFLLSYKSYKMMAVLFDEQTEDYRRMKYYMKLLSGKSSVFELKLFHAVRYILEMWRQVTDRVIRDHVRTTWRAQKYMLFGSILYLVWTGYLVYTIVGLGVTGKATVGLCAALIAAASSIVDNVYSLIWNAESLSEKLIQAEYLNRFLELPETAEYGNRKLADGQITIKFEHVSFTYPGAREPSLKDASFSFSAGEHVAVVGKNGAGKTTLIKLLCRLYKPDSGQILMNGIPLEEFQKTALQTALGVVFQDYGSYYMTLRENVAFGALEHIDDDLSILSALEKAGFPKEKSRLDDVYGKLEENGIDLSGGEWQKVAIARAYISDCRFLILDEPAAALDPMAESALYQGFLSLMEEKEKGCLIVSHRLASARMADRVIVLDQGRVAEEGTHEELLGKDGIYANMWQAQSGLYQ